MGDTELRRYLDWLRIADSPNFLAIFLLKHGKDYGINKRTFHGRRMMAKACFRNATLKAHRDPGLTYVEGFIHTILPLHHAWLIDRDGVVIEPTLSTKLVNGNGRTPPEYFGVPFDTDFLCSFLTKTRRYGLLGGDSPQSQDLMRGKTDGFLAQQETPR